jgi:hypothetical protein
MSLKTFHVIFITAASALAFGCCAWGLKDYWSRGDDPMDLVFGLGAAVGGVALIVYGRYILKKLNKEGAP